MKIAIIGFGLEGQAAYDYWKQDNDITVCDQNSDVVVSEGVTKLLGDTYLQNLDQFDLIIRSPFVHPKKIVEANSPNILQKVTSCTNEFLKVCPTRNIIGVTGTKGKGTTSTLIAKMLEEAGKTVHLGGNIGVPALELLKNNITEQDWVVLELSSFQLIDLKAAPHIGVCLMVVPEHLDWHTDVQEYITAKQQLFVHQDERDVAIYFADNDTSVKIADVSKGHQLPFYRSPGAWVDKDRIVIDDREICKSNAVKLRGNHNLQNVCAAITAVWQVTQDIRAISSVVSSFRGLEHRLELVRTFNDVDYYDDSFGTTPETSIVAMQAFAEPKVVILGGSDKGANYDDLALAVANNNVRHALLIGDQATRIQQSLENVGFDSFSGGGDSMTEIIQNARSIAQPGDVVLLSTGCASFGMFKDYKDRGNQFKAVVQELV